MIKKYVKEYGDLKIFAECITKDAARFRVQKNNLNISDKYRLELENIGIVY